MWLIIGLFHLLFVCILTHTAPTYATVLSDWLKICIEGHMAYNFYTHFAQDIYNATPCPSG